MLKPDMKSFWFWLLLVVVTQNLCLAEVTHFPAEDQHAIQAASKFHEIHSITNLPLAVLKLCSHQPFADPGQPWEETDVVRDPLVPTRRLIWAATDGEYYVVHYERGGRAHSYHIMVAKLKVGEKKPLLVWRGVGGLYQHYETFLAALKDGKPSDDRSGRGN